MADIVDAFVVSLGLDPSNYNREIKKFREDRKRLAEEDEKFNQGQEEGQKRAIAGMRTLRNETAGFMLALAGASSIKSFASNLLGSDAVTGRFASNLGMATEKVAAWELAVRKAGGSEGGGRGILSQMAGVIQNQLQTGDIAQGALLSALGLSSLPQDPEELLYQLAGMSDRMDPQRYRSLLGQLGIDDAGVGLLSKGTQGLRDYIREQERLTKVRKEDTDAAIAFDNALLDIETTIKAKARPAIAGLADAVSDLAADQENMNLVSDAAIGVLGALAIGALAAAPQLTAVALAITAIAAAYRELDASRAGDGTIFGDIKQGWYNVKGAYYRRQADNAWAMADKTTGAEHEEWIRRGKYYENEFSKNRSANRTASEPRAAPAATSAPAGGGRTGGPVMKPRGQPAVALEGNNPGGINDSAWASHQPGYVGNNGRYAAFATMEHGIAAQKALLASYVRRGYNTPAKIANRWAPAADRNNPTAYAATIARQMGIGVNDVIGPAQLNAFQHAQAITENARYARPGMNAGRAAGGSVPVTNNVTVGQITINTSSKDAEGIAKDMRGELAKRGLVTQANTGLTG